MLTDPKPLFFICSYPLDVKKFRPSGRDSNLHPLKSGAYAFTVSATRRRALLALPPGKNPTDTRARKTLIQINTMCGTQADSN